MTAIYLSDLITQPLHTVPLSATLADATSLMKAYKLSSLLIADEGVPEGIITERDVLNALAESIRGDQPVSTVMSTPVLSALDTTEFKEGYHKLALYNIRHLLVTDKNGTPKGVVSDSDFRNHLSSSVISRLQDLRSLMSSHTLTVPHTTPLMQAIQAMVSHRFSCVIATENNIPCGILTEYDAVRLYNNTSTSEALALNQVMHSPVKTIPENTSIPVALEVLQQHGIRHLVVVDKAEHVVGIITEHEIVHQIEIEFANEMRKKNQLSQTALKRHENKLHAIFNTTNIHLILLDTHAQIVEINAAILRECGHKRAEVLNTSIWDTVWRSDDASQKEHLRQVLDEANQGLTRMALT